MSEEKTKKVQKQSFTELNAAKWKQLHQTKLISVTPNAEKLIAYCARVSNPKNQTNRKIRGLLRYCIKHGHWSIFQQAFATIEIKTTRAISAQIIRHRSFTYQEFSQRYAPVTQFFPDIPIPDLRTQDKKNRQSSHDDLDQELKERFQERTQDIFSKIKILYGDMLRAGVAKESARFILPMCSPTTLYMSGSVRDWIHYINTRTHEGTQAEHRWIAEQIKELFIFELPIVSDAMGWCNYTPSDKMTVEKVKEPSGMVRENEFTPSEKNLEEILTQK